MGVETPTGGSIKLGHNVAVDYFAQEADFHLRPGVTVLAEMEAESPGASPEWLRGLLGAFLFSGDDVSKPVAVLSGGEKARLALAKMLLHPSNFLILDEPTNHLDMSSQEVLLRALQEYDGTLLVVSHDRYFLDRLVHRVLELDSGVLRDWHGDLSDYLARKLERDQSVVMRPGTERIPVAERTPSAPKSREQRRQEAEIRNRFSRQINEAREKVQASQKEIERMERRRRELETLLADERTYQDGEKSKALLSEYEAIRRKIEAEYGEWERAVTVLEECERQREAHIQAAERT